jgi:hypothetical protein
MGEEEEMTSHSKTSKCPQSLARGLSFFLSFFFGCKNMRLLASGRNVFHAEDSGFDHEAWKLGVFIEKG